jgi:hypothetical protein
MLIKIWVFAVVLAMAAVPFSSLLAAPGGGAGTSTGSAPTGDNATSGTAAANASTPSGRMDAAGARAGGRPFGASDSMDSSASANGSTGKSTTTSDQARK